jgi:hypothetical protein
MLLSEGVELFLEHRCDKGLCTDSLGLYRYWLDLWGCWRERRSLSPDLAAISASELRAFFRYLEREQVPHGTNPTARQLSVWECSHRRARAAGVSCGRCGISLLTRGC